MAFIAGIALDAAAIRAWRIHQSDGKGFSNTIDVLYVGSLPMANVLVVGLIALFSRPARRAFLSGFVASGTLALALYVAIALTSTESHVMPYLHAVLRPVSKALPQNWSALSIVIFYSITAAMLGVPQLIIAVLGGSITKGLGDEQRGRRSFRRS